MFSHVDADAFFASVLVRSDPALRGKPLLALGMGGGCVIAASYEAKAKGVKTGMRVSEARVLCPDAILRQSDFAEACRASQQIEAILSEECPCMERASVDEWHLDLRALQGGIPRMLDTWAKTMHERIAMRTALSVSLGIAPSKTLAKMASEYRKPAGITIIECGIWNMEYRISQHSTFYIPHSTFLVDRSAAAIPGIGKARMQHTDAHGWKSAWEFANAPQEEVSRLFGKVGHELQEELQGRSVYGIAKDHAPPKSISRCRSFRKTEEVNTLCAYLLEHLTYCSLKMRAQNLSARRIVVWLRDEQYRQRSTQIRLSRLMDTEEDLAPFARRCLASLTVHSMRFTQVGLALVDLLPLHAAQYSLFEPAERTDKKKRLQEALDTVYKRFGRDAIRRGICTGDRRKRSPRSTLYGAL